MIAYLITDGCYGADTPAAFEKRLFAILKHHRPDYALYRDKTNPRYSEFAERFMRVCHAFEDTKCLLHGDAELALKLGAYGVHLTSEQFDAVAAAKAKGLFTVISTHSEAEIRDAVRLGADAVTYSPVFHSPGKGEPRGLEDLKDIAGKMDTRIIALGGIVTSEQIAAVQATGVFGFASIRYFTIQGF